MYRTHNENKHKKVNKISERKRKREKVVVAEVVLLPEVAE